MLRSDRERSAAAGGATFPTIPPPERRSAKLLLVFCPFILFCSCFSSRFESVYTMQLCVLLSLLVFFYRARKCRTSEVNRLGRRQTLLLVWEALNAGRKREGEKSFSLSRNSLRDDAGAVPPLFFFSFSSTKMCFRQKVESFWVYFFKCVRL